MSSTAKPGELKSEDNFVKPSKPNEPPTSTDIDEDNQDELRVLWPAFFLAGPRTRAFDLDLFFARGKKEKDAAAATTAAAAATTAAAAATTAATAATTKQAADNRERMQERERERERERGCRRGRGQLQQTTNNKPLFASSLSAQALLP